MCDDWDGTIPYLKETYSNRSNYKLGLKDNWRGIKNRSICSNIFVSVDEDGFKKSIYLPCGGLTVRVNNDFEITNYLDLEKEPKVVMDVIGNTNLPKNITINDFDLGSPQCLCLSKNINFNTYKNTKLSLLQNILFLPSISPHKKMEREGYTKHCITDYIGYYVDFLEKEIKIGWEGISFFSIVLDPKEYPQNTVWLKYEDDPNLEKKHLPTSYDTTKLNSNPTYLVNYSKEPINIYGMRIDHLIYLEFPKCDFELSRDILRPQNVFGWKKVKSEDDFKEKFFVFGHPRNIIFRKKFG